MDWRTYLTLGRVSNLPTIWTNVLAGTILVGARPSPSTLFLVLSLSLFYGGGMFLNDAFDREWDARERPDRPIPAGLISARRVFVVGGGMLGGGVVLAVLAATPEGRGLTLATAAALAAAILLYDAWHKGNPISPVLMGTTRALVYATAGAAAGARFTPELLAGALVLLAYLIGLTYVAKQETLGEIRNLWPLIFLATPFVYAAPAAMRSASGALLYGGLVACVGYALTLLFGQSRRVPRAVVTLIAGISLLDGVLMAYHGGTSLAWLGVGGFAATMAAQRIAAGT